MNLNDKIEGYINNTLIQQERKAFEAEVQKSETLQHKLHLHHLTHKILSMNQHLHLLEIVESIAAEEYAKKKSLITRIKDWLDKLGFGAFLRDNLEKVIKRKFTPYIAAVSIMGDTIADPTSVFIQGMKEYDLQEYAKAVILLKKVESLSPNYLEAQFYLGNAYLALQKPALSIVCLEETINSGEENDYYSSTNWYRALALLQLGEKNTAVNTLQELKITDTDSYYQNKAAEILKELGL